MLRDIPRRTIALVLTLSGLGGLFEAGLLVLIVQVATQATGTAKSGVSRGLIGDLVGSLTILENVGLGVAFALLSIALQLTATIVMLRAAADKLNRDRARIVRAFYASSVTSQGSLAAGTLQDLAANSANRLAEGVYMTGQAASAWTNLGVLVAAAFVASPWTALAMIVIGVVMGAAFAPVTKAVTRHSRAWVLRAREYGNFLAIYTRMFVEVRVFGVSGRVESLAVDGSEQATEAWRRGKNLQMGTPLVFRNSVLLLGFLVIGLVTLIARDAVGGIAITALLLVRGLVYVQSVLGNRQSIKAMSTHGELIEKTLQSLAPDPTTWGHARLQDLQSIELRAAAHSYDADMVTFSEVDVTVRRGEFVAIVGPSGGGKTTLLKVLMRTVEPTAGQLLVNGRPIEEFRRDDWYRVVAYLSQEVRLIPGTIADNIRFYRDAGDGDVRTAAARAVLELDPVRFPDGIETRVEQDGQNLSGGQRQRIGLARCLLTNPQLLVLDEPTSALDDDTERAIMETVDALHASMIVVMVTHRPSTLQYVDARFQMTGGRLAQLV